MTHLNLGAAGLIVALVLAGLALCGLIATCRFVFAYLKRAHTLKAVKTTAGGASQLKEKKLGAGLILAVTADVCLPPQLSVLLFSKYQRLSVQEGLPETGDSVPKAYTLCCKTLFPAVLVRLRALSPNLGLHNGLRCHRREQQRRGRRCDERTLTRAAVCPVPGTVFPPLPGSPP